tara:strand:+ start:704 stop:1453 length:750 start_codon:yes stop_codon:yes gene_type:complete
VKKTLITFVHYYRPEQELFQDNLNFFVKNGIINTDQYHYNFIINSGEEGGYSIPNLPNVSVLRRENLGHDFGAFKFSVDSINIDEYEHFLFINDTCRGPFFPSYIPKNISWVYMFTKDLSHSVKMVGPTWWSSKSLGEHIQSYCFALDHQALNLLLDEGKFDSGNKDKNQIIFEHEIECSQFLLRKGFQIKPFQLSQFGSEKNEDIVYENRYFGDTINPLEVMFIKTNRIMNQTVKNYTEWILHEKINR